MSETSPSGARSTVTTPPATPNPGSTAAGAAGRLRRQARPSRDTGLGFNGSNALLLLGTLTVFLLVWEAAVVLFDVSAVILPRPSLIARALWRLMVNGNLPRHLGYTVAEIALGFAIGSLLGIVMGTGIALSKTLSRILYPYIIVLQVIPKVAIAPLFVIWFGYGLESKVVMAVLISFFPLLVNTIAGLNHIQSDYLDLMTALTASRAQTFRYVRFPNALPFIFAGLEAGIVLSVIGALVAEFVGAGVGLGYLILLYNANLNVPGVFAVLVVLAVLGVGLHALIGFARKRVVFWSGTTEDHFTGA